MPTYTIRDPVTGRTLTIRGDSPPTEQELVDLFAAAEPMVNVGTLASYTVNNQPVIEAPSIPVESGPGILEQVGRGALSVASGVGKGAGRTAYELGRIAQATTPTLRMLGQGIAPGSFSGESTDAFPELKTKGPLEDAGLSLERLLEFLAPGGQLTKTRQAVGAMRNVPRWAKLGTQAAIEAVPAAAITAMQGDGSPGMAAALAGTMPLVGDVAGPLVGKLARRFQRGARKSFEQAINPTTRRAKADTARIAAQALRSGVKGSLESVADVAQKKANVLNDALDRVWTTQGGRRTPVSRFVNKIEGLKAEHLDSMGLPLTPDDAKAIGYLTELQDSIAAKGPMIDWNDVRKINQSLASDVAAAGGYSEKTGGMFGVNLDDASRINAKRGVSGVYREEMAADIPGAAAINKPLSLQLKIAELASMTKGRKTGQKNFLGKWLPRLAGATLGTGAGVAAGDSGISSVINGIAGAALGGKVMQVMDSPRWHLFSGRAKQRLADALAGGDRGAIAAAVGRLLAEEGATGGRAAKALMGVVPQ